MFLTIFFCLLCSFHFAKQETVKVSLYYESLCPYSKEFIVEQLYPGYQKLGDALVLDLVPFGKAKMNNKNGKWTFTCQHGPKECFGNRIQACVLGQNLTQEESVGFINCIMSTDEPQRKSNARNCLRNTKLSWTVLKTCIDGHEGTNLLVHYGNVTGNLTPKLMYVPHIIFNDVFNEDYEEEARSNFLQTACNLFSNKPSVC